MRIETAEAEKSINAIVCELQEEKAALCAVSRAMLECEESGNEISEAHLKTAYEEISKAINASLSLTRLQIND